MLSLVARRTAAQTTRYTVLRRALSDHYTKADVGAQGEPVTRHDGTWQYVVSTPADADKPFDVPPGAFQSQTTPQTGPAASAPPNRPTSSASASPAHPTTTKQAMEGTLADRNPPPTAEVGKKGLGAWADRK